MTDTKTPTNRFKNEFDQFHLTGAWNFRDVSGARASDGRVVRSGILYRSSELSQLTEEGRTALNELGVRHVFDLRAHAEIARSGKDRVGAAVTVHSVPYEDRKGERAPHERGAHSTADAQAAYMMRAYESFPTLPGAAVAIKSVVTTLAADPGSVLVHCAAGKDRAGWTVATVLRAAGVTEADVLADFKISNSAVDPLRAHVHRVWEPGPDGEPPNLTDALLGVSDWYLRHGLSTVDRLYGSFEGYLEHLQLDAGTLAKLKTRLLTEA